MEMVGIVFALAIIILAICFWQITLIIIATPVAIWLGYVLVMFVYRHTPIGKRKENERLKREAERLKCEQDAKLAAEKQRIEEQELQKKKIAEAKKRRQKEIEKRWRDKFRKFCDALRKLDYDRMIVDTNVFMNAAEGDDEESEFKIFFWEVENLKHKIFIVNSQLNELQNIKKGRDESKKYKARRAQKIMEKLQNLGLLELLGDVIGRTNYADPEIIKVARELVKDGYRPLVITDDTDLRLRLGAEHILRKSIAEIYNYGGPEFYKDVHFRGVHCGKKFVCLENNGETTLVANGKVADSQATFNLVEDDQHAYSLVDCNGKYICVDDTRGGILVARHEKANEWTKFVLEPIHAERPTIALKSKATGKYVSVCENNGNVLMANASEIRDWEIIEFC